ncbi:unnamed protein product [Eruca vesicaria subsp. sativa]|uniref:Leucine-rich repeat-containing N-terminal plant-type domain-containing protein n=1 Tax=Eruca vesicaria subsp. sativa TaxID=29727 RepID=A0ABC8KNQ1_ERUVS|nr:unnamed protein product [Eruca vesicaria subsp. sativa]
MERKVLLGQKLILVILLLGELHGYKSCIEKERKALLDLKKHVVSQSFTRDPDFILTDWTNDTKSDCCRWNEIKCSRTSGRVINLSIGYISRLEENSLLNLSLLHPFEEIQSLDLSGDYGSGFSAMFDDVEGYESLSKLKNLEILDLSSNNYSNSIFPFLNAATSIKTLLLGDNTMYGPFPVKDFINLTNLEVLDLSGNRFNSSVSVQDSPHLMKLKALDLSGNELSNSMELQGICKLKNLQELDISHNELSGQFPICIASLTGLRALDLSSNQLTGKVPSTLGNLRSIEYLSLVNNNFEGLFSFNSLTNLSRLKVITLCSKSNSLQVELGSSWKPKFQLTVVQLGSCNLVEVPQFFLHQKDLRHVDLSNNNISGLFPSWLLENNTKLDVLDLQRNLFTSFQLPKASHHLIFLDVSANEFSQIFPQNIGWILPHLHHMNLSQNSFYGNLPSSLGNMDKMYFLDISHNSFHGELPRSFEMGCVSLRFLKLSHNKLSGEIFAGSPNFTSLDVLLMDNNQFRGNIREGLRGLHSLRVLDMSNNYLTGVIPSWIGEFLSLNALFISNNLLEGEIPVSVFNMLELGPLDLSANNLSGTIPPRLKSIFDVVLNVQDNNLLGPIPDTLLENVAVLDLRNNKLSGNIPEFVHTQNISILLLKGNNLTGPIPQKLCEFSIISLLDLSNNKLNGSIPSCLSKTSFGKGKEYKPYGYDFDIGFGDLRLEVDSDSNYPRRYYNSVLVLDSFSLEYTTATQTKIKFAAKQRYDTYMGGSLKYLFGLDLSENELTGDIPEELGDLLELHALNLSRNGLSGALPETFSRLENMESLDLSFNSLQGEIPSQLTEMRSLAVFNVSYNDLSGVIPQGKQFNTFDESSYIGNPHLCGKPTVRSCSSINVSEADDDAVFMESFRMSFIVGYVTIVLVILASLSCDSPWRRAWFSVVDAFNRMMRSLSS